MNVPGVTSSAFLGGLSAFFDRTCTINEDTGTTKSAAGMPIANWTALTGHSNLACRVAPITALGSSGRRPGPEMTVSVASQVIILAGHHPLVTTAMQAVVGGVTYAIKNVLHDSEQLATELVVEKVTT